MPSRSPSQPEQITDLGPRVFLVTSVSDHVGQPNLDLALQAGEQVHRDRGIAEPVQSAKRTQGGNGFVKDRFTELIGAGADVVSTICRCHSRIMPDTTAFVIQAGREHPRRVYPQTRAATYPIDEPNPGAKQSNSHSSGAKIREDSGAKTLDDTQVGPGL
jgi:hypothetical protein